MAFKCLKLLISITTYRLNCSITLKNSYYVSWFHSYCTQSLFCHYVKYLFSYNEIRPFSFAVDAAVTEIVLNMVITSFGYGAV